MEPESSLLCSQEPATGPYTEPDNSSHTLQPFFLRFILILSSYLCSGLSSGLFASGFPTKILYAFLISTIHAICSAYLILHDLIILIIPGEKYKLRSSSLCMFLNTPVIVMYNAVVKKLWELWRWLSS
jgi:hypothetical protein